MDPQQYPQQQPPQQPQYQQYPQQMPQYPQQDGYQPPQKKGGINYKLLGFGAGGFLLLILILSIVAVSSGSESSTPEPTANQLALTSFSDSTLTFSVELPDDWTTETQEREEGYTFVVARPEDKSPEDQTSIVIGREVNETDPETFIDNINNSMDFLLSSGYQELSGKTISNFKSENYGTQDEPAFEVSYKITKDDESEANVLAFFIYESEDSVVNATFTYSSEYPKLEDTATLILQTYEAN